MQQKSPPLHLPTPPSRYREGMRRWRCGLGLLPAINEMLKRIKQEVNSSIQISPSLLENRLPILSHRRVSPRAWMGSRAEHFSRLLHRFFLKALSPFFLFFFSLSFLSAKYFYSAFLKTGRKMQRAAFQMLSSHGFQNNILKNISKWPNADER